MAALIFLLACTERATGVAACEPLGDPISREECRYDAIQKVMDDPGGFTAALDSFPDTSRDLVLYRLAVDQPARARHLCGLTRTAAMTDKCSKLLGRPHMSGPPPVAPVPAAKP